MVFQLQETGHLKTVLEMEDGPLKKFEHLQPMMKLFNHFKQVQDLGLSAAIFSDIDEYTIDCMIIISSETDLLKAEKSKRDQQA
jgi:hypothetical protein